MIQEGKLFIKLYIIFFYFYKTKNVLVWPGVPSRLQPSLFKWCFRSSSSLVLCQKLAKLLSKLYVQEFLNPLLPQWLRLKRSEAWTYSYDRVSWILLLRGDQTTFPYGEVCEWSEGMATSFSRNKDGNVDASSQSQGSFNPVSWLQKISPYRCGFVQLLWMKTPVLLVAQFHTKFAESSLGCALAVFP